MGTNMNERHCPNCGAPLTTEICPYCHVATGLDTKNADMEYEVIECKEATIGFWNVAFPMIFAVSFGFFGLLIPILLLIEEGKEAITMCLFFSIFGIVGVAAFIIGIKPIIRYLSIKMRGKEIEATVYGYMEDNVLLNGIPAQIVKLLVNTDDGPKFILYQLGDIKNPYKVNSKIKLRVYKDMFLITNKKKYYFN